MLVRLVNRKCMELKIYALFLVDKNFGRFIVMYDEEVS